MSAVSPVHAWHPLTSDCVHKQSCASTAAQVSPLPLPDVLAGSSELAKVVLHQPVGQLLQPLGRCMQALLCSSIPPPLSP
jgi:hypothetical protein